MGTTTAATTTTATRDPTPNKPAMTTQDLAAKWARSTPSLDLTTVRKRRSSHEQSPSTLSPPTPLATLTGPSSQSAGAARTTPAGSNTPGGAPSLCDQK